MKFFLALVFSIFFIIKTTESICSEQHSSRLQKRQAPNLFPGNTGVSAGLQQQAGQGINDIVNQIQGMVQGIGTLIPGFNPGFVNRDILANLILMSDGAVNTVRFFVRDLMYRIWTVLPPSTSERMTVSQDGNNIVVRDKFTNQPITALPTMPGIPNLPGVPNLVPNLSSFSQQNQLPNYGNLLPNQQNGFNPNQNPPNNMFPNQQLNNLPNQFPSQQNMNNLLPNQQTPNNLSPNQQNFPNPFPNQQQNLSPNPQSQQQNFGQNIPTPSPQAEGASVPSVTQGPFNPFDIFGRRR